jgi:LPXTG-site transpeptidase (sortase) family protein
MSYFFPKLVNFILYNKRRGINMKLRNRFVNLIGICLLIAAFGFRSAGNVAASPEFTALADVSTTIPTDVFIGDSFSFTVLFENSGDTVGYGPYIDMVFPSSGIDGDDGVTFLGASYFGLPVTAIDQVVVDTAPLGDGLGCITHPYAKDSANQFIQVCGLTVNDHYISLLLPFGSFVPGQSLAEIDVQASVSNLADLGEDLTIATSGGYMFGNDPLNNPGTDPSIVGSPSLNTVNPTLFTLTKSYNGPEDETATGPNYPRTYTLRVDVAAGQVLQNFNLLDSLPGNMQFISVLSSSVPYTFAASSFPSTSLPGGDLSLFYPAINGSTDLQVEVQFYIPLNDESSNRVIDPLSGNDVLSCNQVSGVGDWDPLDPRDDGAAGNAQAGSNDGSCAGEEYEHELTDKSIAIQKSVAIVSDQSAAGTSPEDVLQYSIDFQISDYFGFDNLVITDTFSDGQHWDTSYTPTLSVNGNQYALSGAFASANYAVDTSEIGNDPDVDTDGTTTVTFNVSGQIAASQGFGWMVGGCVPVVAGGSARDTSINPGLTPDCTLYNNGATTATITFRTIIQDQFSDTYPSGDASVDQGDELTNDISIVGDLLSVEDLSHSGYQTEADDSSSAIAIEYGVLSKTIYAVNGNTTFDTPLRVAPGDTVTYRFQYTLPTSDFEGLEFVDYLPLPIFDSTEIHPPFDSTVSGDVPDAGQAKFGPADTFFNYSGIIPLISTVAAQNTVTFDYGNYDSPSNQSNRIDILFTVTVKNDPFADGLFLTNQVSGFENSTNAGTNAENAIVQIQLTEPVPAFSKGVVWVSGDQSHASFSPAVVGPVTFSYDTGNPANCSRFSGVISSGSLAAAPVNSNLSGVDAGDIALMALVVENSGSGLYGAFDVTLSDALPSGLTLVPGSLCVSDGSGAAFTYSGNLFGAGLRLEDPGPTNPALGGLDPYDADNGHNIAVVTYAVSVDSGVGTGETLINEGALTNFAGSEGGADHTVTDLEDTASVSTLNPSFDKAFNGTELNSAGNGAGQAVIGELATYTLTATFQEGISAGVQIIDTLDAGLAFVDLVSVSASSGISSSVMTFNASGLCTNCSAGSNPLVENSGQRLTFNLGDVSNSNRDNTAAETVTLVYRVIVLNVIGNQAGTALNNSAVFSWDDGSLADSAENVSVVEPDLTISKSYQRTFPTPAALTPVDAGDEITYSIGISNTSVIDAYDVLVSDTLPTTYISPWVVSAVTDSAGLLSTADFSISGGLLSTLPASAFDLPANNARTVTIQVRGTVLDTILPNQIIPNTANVSWSSLDGAQNDRSAYNDASDERTGADGVGSGLNNYAKNSNTSQITAQNLSGTKYFVSSSDAGTLDTASPPRLTIGEIVRYRLAMLIPEGTSTDLAMLDQLPNYLRFLNDGTAKFAFVSQAGISSSSLSGGNVVGSAADLTSLPSASISAVLPDAAVSSSRTSNADVYASGTDIYFKFGTVTNTEDNDSDAEYIVVEFNALVENDPSNQAYNNSTGATTTASDRANNFRGYLNVSTSNNLMFTSNNVTIRIAEPAITNLDKVITSPSPAVAEAGDTINYTVTFSNVSGTNASPAYDVVFTDAVPSKLSLIPASAGVSATCALTSTNNTSGNTVSLTFPTIPTGCALTITYSATVNVTVYPGETLNNSARVTYSSLPGDYGTTPNPTGSTLVSGSNTPGSATGERNGSGGNNDYADSDLVGLGIIQISPTKSLVSSNDPNTIANDLTIGETARYRLEVLLSQATSPNFSIHDYLPDGMSYLNDGFTNLAFVSENGITSSTISGAGLHIVGNETNLSLISPTFALPAGAISLIGNDPIFSLGELVNTDDDDNSEFVLLEFNARLLNETGNQLTSPVTSRTNYFTVSIDGLERSPSNNVVINVLEPRITTSKSVDQSADVESGDLLTYTLLMTNSGTSFAYDVSFRDDLAQGVAYNAGSMVCLLNGVEIANSVTDNGSYLLVSSNPDGLWDIPVGQSLQCTYTVTALSSLTIDGEHTNTADADWSSLNDNPAEERDYDDGTTYGVDGTQDTASAVFAVDAPVLTKTVDLTSAAIGQTVTYTLTIDSPLGTLQDFVVQDILPAGLIFSGTPVFSGLPTPTQTVSDPNDGLADVSIEWDFGDAVIASSPVSITYQAIVANVLANQQGLRLTNEAHLEYTNAEGDPITGASESTDVDLVEAALTLEKTFNSSDAPFDGGDTIQYSLLVSNNSGTTAYDALVSDTLFGDSPTILSVDAGTSGAAVTASLTGNDLTVTIDAMDDGESVTITVQVTLPGSVTPGQSVENDASLTWTSTPDDDNVHERSGADGAGGALNDYATGDDTSFVIDMPAIEKSILSTSHSHSADQDLAIGEVATFELLVQFPEGTIPAPIAIHDQMPDGLNLLGITEIDTTNLNATIASGDPTDNSTTGLAGTLLLDFAEDVIVAGNNDPTDNVLRIVYEARLDNVLANQNNGTWQNEASLDWGVDSSLDADPVEVTVVEPELQVVKTSDVSTPAYGQTITYTLAVSHLSTSTVTAFQIAVSDQIPAGLTYVGSPASITAPTGWVVDDSNAPLLAWSCSAPACSLATGDSAVLSYQATVDLPPAAEPSDVLTNGVEMTWASLPDDAVNDRDGSGGVNDYQDDSQVGVTLTSPDLSITKTDGVTSYVPGTSLTYTIAVSNVGNGPAIGAQVTDSIPAQFSAWSWTCVQSGGATGCSAYSGAGNFSNTVSLPVGSSITYTVNATILASAAGSLTNTAAVTPPGGLETDPTPENNSATDVDTQDSQVDLSASKDDGVTAYVPGGSLTYSITVSNAGPSDAPNSLVSDTIPAQFSSWEWTCGAVVGLADGCDGLASSSADFSDTVNLPAGTSISYTVEAQVASSATGDLTNTVTVSPATGITDLDPANNSASDTDTQDSQADLGVVKDDGVTAYVPGSSLTYTITVINDGPSDAPNSAVSDTIPAQFSSWEWSCGAVSGGASGCDAMASSSGDFSDTIDLPAGSSLAYSVVAQVASSATGSLTNTVSVSTAPGISDTNSENNSSTDVDTQDSQADLNISKDDGVDDYVPGETLTYTIVVSNPGPSDAPGSQVSDSLPAQFSSWEWSCGAVTGSASGCDPMADSAANFSDEVDLPANSSITYSVLANILSSASGDLENTAVVSTGTGITDTNPEDNSDTDTDAQNSISDIGIEKSVLETEYLPGGTMTYQLLVTNYGPSDAQDVVIAETVPDYTAFNGTVGWVCDPLAGGAGAVCSYDLGYLADGASTTVEFAVTIDNPIAAGVTEIYNVTSVESGSEDSNPDNNQDDLTVSLVAAPDMTITKDDGFVQVAPGSSITYSILVSNAGNQAATGVTVTDTLPAGVSFVSASNDGSYDADTREITWLFAEFAGQTSVSLTVQVTVDDPFLTGSNEIVNGIVVEDDGSNGDDPTPENNQAEDRDLISSIGKIISATNQEHTDLLDVAVGEIVTYQVNLTVAPGNSQNQVMNLVFEDVLDAGLAFVGCSSISTNPPDALVLDPASGYTLDGLCTMAAIGTYPADSTDSVNQGRRMLINFGNVYNNSQSDIVLTIEYQVVVLNSAGNVSGQRLANEANWSWEGGSLEMQAAPVTVVEPELEISKSLNPSTALLGQVVTYSITVKHTDESETDAFNVLISDLIPPQLTYVPGSLVLVSGTAPTLLSDVNVPYLRIGWDVLPLSGTETVISYQARITNANPGQTINNTAALVWTSLPGDESDPQSPFNPNSTERTFVPSSNVDDYGANSSARLTIPELPATGFEQGVMTQLPAQPDSKQYTALGDLRLEIPKQNLDLPIIGIPLNADGWDLTWLSNQIGYLEGTAYPTWSGNTGLTAHVYNADGSAGPFVNLHLLKWGDKILIHAFGRVYTYEVRSVERIGSNDLRVLNHETSSTLTLLTCQGYDEVNNRYTWRVAVRAVLVSVD